MAKKILIIEDDEHLGGIYQAKFKMEGFTVFHAQNGEDGIKIAAKEQPDLILLDILMPGMDGYQVLRGLNCDKKTKGIPVVILSNLGQRDDVQKGIEAGACDYIIKVHFTPSEIVRKVKKILNQK